MEHKPKDCLNSYTVKNSETQYLTNLAAVLGEAS